jgi:hypothetical protein
MTRQTVIRIAFLASAVALAFIERIAYPSTAAARAGGEH